MTEVTGEVFTHLETANQAGPRGDPKKMDDNLSWATAVFLGHEQIEVLPLDMYEYPCEDGCSTIDESYLGLVSQKSDLGCGSALIVAPLYRSGYGLFPTMERYLHFSN